MRRTDDRRVLGTPVLRWHTAACVLQVMATRDGWSAIVATQVDSFAGMRVLRPLRYSRHATRDKAIRTGMRLLRMLEKRMS